MKCPAIFSNESERLKALSAYGLDEEQQLRSLEPVVHIATRMFDMPVAAINMIGSDHVFFAASVGVGDVDKSRDVSFCAHAINQAEVLVVRDTKLDERFHDNPLVTGETNLRFYAGARLLSPEGYALGALCIIDDQPHPDFSSEDAERLLELAKMASDRLELRRIQVATERTRPAFIDYAKDSINPVIWFDEHYKILDWNAAAANYYGYTLADKTTLLLSMLIPNTELPAFDQLITQAFALGSLEHLEVPEYLNGMRKDGALLQSKFGLSCWRNSGHLLFEITLVDVATKQMLESLHRQAEVDSLTGLANRTKFYHCVEQALLKPTPLAILMIDLDSFKDINDTLGYQVGDAILCEVGDRLCALSTDSDVVARIGGDEFAVMLSGITDSHIALGQADLVIAAIAKPIQIQNHKVRVAATCGISMAPAHAQEALKLVSDADLALFKAKSIGAGSNYLFDPALRTQAMARRLYGLELHRAVDEGEFLVVYQPQFNLSSGAIAGAEALIRWQHPERGLLAPAAFLPALESGTLAANVGAWILNEACAQAAYWRRNCSKDFRIGVNLCAAQFYLGDLAADVMAILDEHGLPTEALELEVTENIVLNNEEIVLQTLRRMYDQGIGIAFDDFGTGYASLSLLKNYPVTRIKIDRSFVSGIQTSKRDTSVIRAVLDVAQSFGLETIAEGIETEAQFRYLQREKCTEGQGYLFGKPMSAAQMGQILGMGNALKSSASGGS